MSFLVGLDLNDVQVQTDSGNASTTAFTLTVASTTNAVAAYISGVRQLAGTDYSVSGTTITFTTAPPTGTNNIMYVYTKAAIINTPADNSVTSAKIVDGTIVAADLADNAITLAKMAHGTDGNLITYDAAGAPAAVATGNSGQILTSGGAGVAPTFAAAAAGGSMQFISTVEASSSATIAITFTPGDADTFKIFCEGVVPASDDVTLQMEFSTDGGSSYYSSDYQSDSVGRHSGTTVAGLNDALTIGRIGSDSAGEEVGSTTGEHLNAEISIHNPSDTALFSMVSGHLVAMKDAANNIQYHFVLNHGTAGDIDAVRFSFTSGNIESGRFTLHKITHS